MSKDSIARIALWSGPRNISTALMYSFAQREDTKVFDEPLYGYYLKNSTAKEYHPGSDEVLKTMQTDGQKVVDFMLANSEKPILFFKNMTHHLLDLDRSFMKDMIHVILTRDPRDMLPSFDKVIKNPSMEDVGYQSHIELIDYFEANTIKYVVLDAKKVLENPRNVLKQLCEFINIPFDERMLKWKPQQRPEDGIWAKYWYKSVHNSSGFEKYKPKTEPFPERLNSLLESCQLYYRKLSEMALS
ncbi:sulfotransferase family protein [Psychroserpens sp. XS_ASV72]|uniref:sulfotransferase-like domain-containing protein n=1 Tax=Psychroserpens sp. XS_ASV72 TaxID=3241293 RepID=UPI003515A7AF